MGTITGMTGLEAALESLPQIVLQVHTILNGYPTTWIQVVCIFTSFAQISMSSITSDLQVAQGGQQEEMSLTKKLVVFLERLPCYLFTVSFRSLSLALCISFLRYWSLLPIIILFIEMIAVAIWRMNRAEGKLWIKVTSGGFLLATNIGTMNAFTFWTENEKEDFQIKEEDGNIASFVKISAIVTTIHHFLVLAFILITGILNPNFMEHWETSDFLLKPSTHDFKWSLSMVMFVFC